MVIEVELTGKTYSHLVRMDSFVQNDLSRVIAESIIPAGWTSFDYFQTEEINPNIHPDLGGYLLAKRIVECNE